MLRKLDQTENAWIFHFSDPVHYFHQTIVVPKSLPADAVEEAFGMVYGKFRERLREIDWTLGNK